MNHNVSVTLILILMFFNFVLLCGLFCHILLLMKLYIKSESNIYFFQSFYISNSFIVISDEPDD